MRTLAIGCACAALCAATAWAGAKDGRLDIYWVDSQGGGSTLVVTPAGESVLVDAGNPGGRDAGRIHRVATEVAGLARIDHLVTTHLHVDHYGGAPELAALMPIGTVHDNGIPAEDPDGNHDPTWPQRIKAYREMKVAAREVVKAGGRLALKPGKSGAPEFSVRFVAARQQYAVSPVAAANTVSCQDPNPRPKDTSDNANSVVTLVEFGGFRFFDGGDVTWNVEAGLVCPVVQVGTVDVYQVNHHGLDVSNNPMLLKSLAPRVAVFNNGPTKGCAPTVVASLRALPEPPAVYQVHRNQSAPDANAKDDHIANPTAEGGRHLMLTVSPDARSYTVAVPSTGHRYTYLVRGGR